MLAFRCAQVYYLLIACLHAEEDDISCCTSQTSFQVRLTSNFFGLHIVRIQGLHRLLEQGSLNLLTDTNKHPGRDMEACTHQKDCQSEALQHNCGSKLFSYKTACQTYQLRSAQPKILLLCQTIQKHTSLVEYEVI